MAEYKTFKDQSRRLWHDETNQKTASYDQIQTGCIQRIADATEIMASNYVELQLKVERLEVSRDMFRDLYHKSERRNAALRGVITKMKKKNK